MSQFGMQMPGAQRARRPSMNAYTGILLCAVACLAAAVVMVYLNGSKIGPQGDPLGAIKVHPSGPIKLSR